MLAKTIVFAASLMFSTISVAQGSGAYADALSLLAQGKYVEAAQAFEALDEKQPSATDALLQAAKARIHQQDYKSAESDLTRFIASHPKSDNALYLLSFVYFREGLTKQSLETATISRLLPWIMVCWAILTKLRDTWKWPGKWTPKISKFFIFSGGSDINRTGSMTPYQHFGRWLALIPSTRRQLTILASHLKAKAIWRARSKRTGTPSK